jgi:hypothetical protein
MLPVRVPKKKYGKFYAGDSYLCLNTSYKVRPVLSLSRASTYQC